MRATRLPAIVAAGVTDSFGLALGWTVFVLHAVGTQGLGAAGAYGAAMLLGVALSAPATGWLAGRLGGRDLLRVTASCEAVLRVVAFLALLREAPLPLVAVLVTLTNVAAWSAYAGMRAEVASVDGRPQTMTAYVVAVAAVEALGVAAAAVLPFGPGDPGGPLLVAVVVVYGASLLPTLLIATGSRVPRAARVPVTGGARRQRQPLAAGFGIMALASGPTLLAAALALELHGRPAVAVAALAFTVGSLLAPAAAGAMARRGSAPGVAWPLLGAGMIAGWALAPFHVAGLVLAQVLAGLSMSAFEGMMDVRVAAGAGGRHVTSALAWAASSRALGSAAATAAAPAAIGLWTLPVTSLGLTAVLATLVTAGVLASRSERRRVTSVRVVPAASRATVVHVGQRRRPEGETFS